MPPDFDAIAALEPAAEADVGVSLSCPYCRDRGAKFTVSSYRGRAGSRVRRRVCGGCGRRFTTREQIDGIEDWPTYG